jgi:uncharacterized membrane protein YhaH (DUF805 family)
VSSPYSPYPQGGEQGEGYGQSPYQPYPPGGGWQPGTPGGDWEPGTQRSYLQGGPVNFGQAISCAFKNAFVYQGRASRSAFWWFFLFSFIIDAVVFGIRQGSHVGGLTLGVIVGIAMLIAWIPLFVRRLHDSGKSGFWALIYIGIIIPIVDIAVAIAIIVLACMPGTPGPNRFG